MTSSTLGRPELCVGAVVVDGERLLLVRRSTDPECGRWSIPGGRVEAGETMVAAVLRELREETGLEGVCGPLVGWVERMGIDHHHVIADFHVNVLADEPLIAGTDAELAAWVSFDRLAATDLVDGLATFLEDNGVVPEGLFVL